MFRDGRKTIFLTIGAMVEIVWRAAGTGRRQETGDLGFDGMESNILMTRGYLFDFINPPSSMITANKRAATNRVTAARSQ